jgi:hypothetical protein
MFGVSDICRVLKMGVTRLQMKRHNPLIRLNCTSVSKAVHTL